jgi:hypothetical protein
MIFEGRAHFACTAIYAMKRGMNTIKSPRTAFFQHFDMDAMAFTQAFTNSKFPDDSFDYGVFGHPFDPEVRSHRVTALCLMADVMESQGM